MPLDSNAKSRRVPHREGRVFSLKLRNGWYALLQMLHRPFVAVFDEFRIEDDWTDIELTSENVLFVCPITRAVLKRSSIAFQTKLQPGPQIELPEWKINSRGFRKVTLWEGTKKERSFLLSGGHGNVGLWRSFCKPGNVGDEYIPISLVDYAEHTEIELANIRDYPEFNERLLLCSELECNYDPLKEMIFDRPIDLVCANYVDIISGRRLSECGY